MNSYYQRAEDLLQCGDQANRIKTIAHLLKDKEELSRLRDREQQLVELLKEYEQWEADIISEDKLWWPNRAKDVLSGQIYDTMLELQEKRNALLNNQPDEK